ncbi:bud site selection protein 21 [[Candida] jaroonii]|uniref:Bud site selection protein 21 n=1 Tax=[Candida] jaroonii TaxID=467808 RepID=A0ACA9YBH7_9ASCO|nr:bud site selection protein 21 [[Candida] jaroonii]
MKIKFDDNEPQAPILEKIKQPIVNDRDSESDSDEAPEEESNTASKSKILKEQQKLKQLEKQQNEINKEKRRNQDLYNKQQQSLKSQKKQEVDDLVIPDVLPEDIINSASTTSIKQDKIKPKHLKLDDFEDRKQIKLQKLKNLKSEVKKGPVHVVVSERIKGVPKSEKVIASRDKWLKRKALGRK